MTQEKARGLPLFEESLLVCEARTQMQNGTGKLQQSFRMQSSAAVSSMMRKKSCDPVITGSEGRYNPSRNQKLYCQRQAWVKLEPALHLLLLMILQFYHLPPPHLPPGSNSSCLFPWCWRPAVVLYTILFRYCTVRFKMCSLFLVFICSLFVWKVL